MIKNKETNPAKSMSLVRQVSIKSIGLLSVIFSLSLALPVLADTASENTELSRIIPILDSLSPLIHAAETQADPQARVKFRYDWLRQDLAKIRSGLVQKIQLPPIEPRTVEPLKGDFVEMGGRVIANPSIAQDTVKPMEQTKPTQHSEKTEGMTEAEKGETP